MRKTAQEIIIFVFIIITGLSLTYALITRKELADYKATVADPNSPPSITEYLMSPDAKWVQIYGSGDESRMIYTIAFLKAVVDNQGRVIANLAKQKDPNGVPK